MCRHLAWLGQPRRLTELVLEPEHGLLVQSYVLCTGGGVVVASEPYDDDPGWTDVPDHRLVDVTGGVVTVTNLEA